MVQSCSGKVAKLVLILFNSIFALSGAAVLAAGIWIKVDPDLGPLKDIIELHVDAGSLNYAAYVLIAFGCLVLLISIFGFCGGIAESKCLLALYILFLVVIFIGEFSAGILAAVFKNKFEDGLKDSLSKHFAKNYNDTKSDWDTVQNLLQCCGARNFTDYEGIKFKNKTENVPLSCCKVSTRWVQCQNETNGWDYDPKRQYHDLNALGCVDSLNNEIETNLGIIIGTGIGIAMIQLLGIVLACCVCRSDNSVDSVY